MVTSRAAVVGGNFFVPCVPYCARRDASSCWRCFSGFPRASLVGVETKERSATLLSRCSPLCCPASLCRILPQRFRPECRSATAKRAVFAWKRRNDLYIAEISTYKASFARGKLVAASQRCRKTSLHSAIIIMHRACKVVILRLKISWRSRC